MRDPATGAMVRAGDQKMVAATFRHDTSRNLDPQLHTHCVVANMVQGGDGKWRTMVDDGLFKGKMAIGAIYRAELAQGLKDLGYGIEKTHPDGRFEIAGVSREVIDAFSTRRAEIETALETRGLGETGDSPHLAASGGGARLLGQGGADEGDAGRARTSRAGSVRGSGLCRRRRGGLGGRAPFRAPGGVWPCRLAGREARPRAGRGHRRCG